MAILTFATAPWAIGTIYHCIKKGCPFKFGFVAFCTWMFSASWSYDIYIYLRYGYYPETWLPNIFLSSTLYASAGFLWNLEASKKRGVMFSFMSPDWLNTNSSDSFSKLIFHALPFMLFVAILILAFLL
jgi:hypothetical protein